MTNNKTLLHIARSIDPCPRQKHVRWLLAHKNERGDGIEYWVDDYRNLLSSILRVFHALKSSLPVKLRDIGRYKTLSELEDVVSEFRDRRRRKSESLLKVVELYEDKDFSIYYQDDDLKIYRVRNIEEAIILGQGTEWMFDLNDGGLYSSFLDLGPLYIWFTQGGKFLSVATRNFPIEGFFLDRQGYITDFREIYDEYSQIDINSKRLMMLAVASDSAAPFQRDISPVWREFALTISPHVVYSNACGEFCQIYKMNYPEEVTKYMALRDNMNKNIVEWLCL
jgi:hypothetical protein